MVRLEMILRAGQVTRNTNLHSSMVRLEIQLIEAQILGEQAFTFQYG